jgi:hypothetical protein
MREHRTFRLTAAAVIMAATCSVASTGCSKSSDSGLATAPSPTIAPPPPAPPPPSGQVIRIGEPINGTITSDSDCKFAVGDPRFADLCDAFTVTAPENGTLVAAVRATNGPLALRFRTAAGDVIDTSFGPPITGRVPVRAGSTLQIDLAYVGRPPGYPSIPPLAYTLELSVETGDIQKRGRLSAIVFGDTTKTQRLPNVRLEALDGPRAGEVARFDKVTGLYELLDLPAGFVRIRASAPGFDAVEEELVIGAQSPREITLPRSIPLVDANRTLSGMVTLRGSSRWFAIRVKIEILDGPMAGVFTFTDDDMAMYSLRSLPPGIVHVRASLGDLTTQTLSVDVSAANNVLNFSLEQQ